MTRKKTRRHAQHPHEAPGPAAKRHVPVAPPAAPATAVAPVFPQRRAAFGLAAVLLAGTLIRLLHLSDLSLWMDEYVHVMRAKGFLEGSGPLLTDDNNGILLTLCLLPGFAVFGPTVFWARFPSVLFGVGLIYLVYRMGARLFNRYVGLFAASAATLSLFLIFWSRVCRNYAPLAFFYLLLGLVFWAAFERDTDRRPAGWWAGHGISGRHLALAPVAGVLALLSHQLAIFFVFSVAVYALVRFATSFLTTGENRERAKFAWLMGLSLPFLLMVFVPPLGEALKNALAPVLLSNIAEWAIPDWTRLAGLSSERPLEAFDTYNSMLRYDLNWMYIPALAGLVAAFWLRPGAGLWLSASFIVPLILLSFVFREPCLRRYLIFAYPYLLIAAGAFFYAFWEVVKRSLWPGAPALLALALPLAGLLLNARWEGIADLALARKLEGHIVDTRIANWSFTNWKEACAFVAQKRRPGDALMSTVPTAVSFYLDHANVLWFRQAYYDTHEKRYKLNAPDPQNGPSAASFEDLVRTVQQTPRGWLLADYYLDNVFTDERALLWMYQNMHFYPEASGDGSVMVFGWDHALPKPQRQNLVVELGRDDDKTESKIYHMTLPEQLFTQDQIELTLRTRWVDSDREALVLFNDKNAVWMPPNTSNDIEEHVLPLDRTWIRPGTNSIQILYETKRPSDPRKGFALYFLGITGK